MSERELRDGLALAVADEPPLYFDPETVVARAKREHRRQRSLAGVGVATALIAIAAVAVSTALHVNTGPARVRPATGLTMTAPTHVWPPALVRLPVRSTTELRHLAAGWTTELQQFFATRLPEATGLSVQQWGGEAAGDVTPNQAYLDTFATFKMHGVVTGIGVQIEAPGYDQSSPSQDCAQEPHSRCQITWHGALALVVDPFEQATGNGTARTLTVRQYRSDGSMVMVSGYNYDPTAKTSVRPSTTEVPLTVAQLTAIAEDEKLSF